ncbi:hypothetical protein ACODT4_41315 [Streptomyces sp. 2.9]|uniref:hypothetical protein n=1 Tax=Streptomyces tritrimontium TaxID=3406573 RepID=UPI003BB6FA02
MSALEKAGGAAVAVVGAAATVLAEAVRYGIVLAQLTAAGIRLRGLSEQVRSTYNYVAICSASVDRLADQMAGLKVDRDTVSEHHEAAGIMRSVLDEAEAMAASTEELSLLFDETAAAHQADYGPVAEAAQAMPVDPAESEFYANR